MADIEERAEKWAKNFIETSETMFPLFYEEQKKWLITAYLAGVAQTQKDYGNPSCRMK